jgi:coenzyme F420-reducing hydrogenase delta subunit
LRHIGQAKSVRRRATELREQRRRLLVDQERARQELIAADAMVLEEQKIQKNLQRFGEDLPKLPPAPTGCASGLHQCDAR